MDRLDVLHVARRRVGFKLRPVVPAVLVSILVLGLAGTAAKGPVLADESARTLGPVVGAVTHNSAKVFVRTGASSLVKIRYDTDPELSSYLESAVVTTKTSRDYTAQINLPSLSPSTTYYLDIVVDGRGQLEAPYPRFKTFPAPGTVSPFRFVVLTDFKRADNPGLRDFDTFENASAEQPDFVYIGGDFDHRNPTTLLEKAQMFKDLYGSVNTYGDFVSEILRKYPVAHNWDDHDCGEDNADKTYPWKLQSLKVLNYYFPLYPITRNGDWQTFSYGHADFFLLDSRSQRDPFADPQGPEKSMLDGDDLGPEGQLEWLLNGLLESTATWKFVLTPVLFNPTNDSPDSWMGYPDERALIVDHIRMNDIEGVILIAGDRHAGGIDDGTNSDFPEMLVPQANRNSCPPWFDTLGTWSEGIYYDEDLMCNGYGVVSVLTDPDRVLLEVKDETGATRLSYTVPAEPAESLSP